MRLTVRDLVAAETEAALAQAHSWLSPQILGYHHPSYQRLLTSILGDESRCIVAYGDHGKLLGILPYRQAQTPMGAIINAMPFFGVNGLVATPPGLGDRVTRILLEQFCIVIRHPDVTCAALYTPFTTNPTEWLDVTQPDEVVVKFSQSLMLTGTAWPARRAGDLRRAASRGYNIRASVRADFEHIVRLYAEDCRARRIPMKPAMFVEGTLRISEQEGERSPMRWLVAERRGHIVAALLYGQGPLTASYILPCAIPEEKPHQVNALLIATAAGRARTDGVQFWNFESSPLWEGAVYRYKAGWGARLAPYVIMSFYRGRRRPQNDEISAMRRQHPYYYIAPLPEMTGIWPSTAALPGGYERLKQFIAQPVAQTADV